MQFIFSPESQEVKVHLELKPDAYGTPTIYANGCRVAWFSEDGYLVTATSHQKQLEAMGFSMAPYGGIETR